MNIAAVFHKATDNYCYALNDNELVINLQTGYDIDRVVLYWGDPFTSGIMGGKEEWQGEELEITGYIKLKYHKLWSITILPKYKRCRYYFKLYSGDEVIYFFEDGFKTPDEMKSFRGRRQDFYFPWMNVSDIKKSVPWINDTVWYQIFPDRFCNSGENPLNNNAQPWPDAGTKVKDFDFYGGDIKGIISKLDYLKDLGITGIYTTPINQSDSNHKYDTNDYYKIDPHFGTNEDMKAFVRQAHKRGIRVMLDGVFNHCGHGFKQWQDVIKNGKASPYFDWFIINQWPFDDSKGSTNSKQGKYFTFAFSDRMPKLNTNNPDVIKYITDVCSYWVKEYDIDALRLDVSNETSHLFNKELKNTMTSIKSDFYILGEIWHDSTAWLRGDEFDSVMNYPLQECISNFWLDEKTTRDEFEFAVNRCYTMYMRQTNDILFNMLDSHDTVRLITKLNNIDKFYQQMAVLFTMPGTACIYYGTEVALEGGFDPDCRRCMPWKEIENGEYKNITETIKSLISIRNKYKSARSGSITFTKHSKNPRVLSYTRNYRDEEIEIILNCSDKSEKVSLYGKEILFSRFYNENTLSPLGIVIIKNK